ncbi:uncharacterized protein LOC142319773 [Lycorma delicatula]|uniref:uncharacterized protein LOC142319773 n=1 Tax=Lycorma delicatula TaxID=130591 RepID=UPI003F51013A
MFARIILVSRSHLPPYKMKLNDMMVLSTNNLKIKQQSVRGYRNISHGHPRPLPFFGNFVRIAVVLGIFACFFDVKAIFGFDREAELEELKNYKIPEAILSYSEKPNLHTNSDHEKNK